MNTHLRITTLSILTAGYLLLLPSMGMSADQAQASAGQGSPAMSMDQAKMIVTQLSRQASSQAEEVARKAGRKFTKEEFQALASEQLQSIVAGIPDERERNTVIAAFDMVDQATRQADPGEDGAPPKTHETATHTADDRRTDPSTLSVPQIQKLFENLRPAMDLAMKGQEWASNKINLQEVNVKVEKGLLHQLKGILLGQGKVHYSSRRNEIVIRGSGLLAQMIHHPERLDVRTRSQCAVAVSKLIKHQNGRPFSFLERAIPWLQAHRITRELKRLECGEGLHQSPEQVR